MFERYTEKARRVIFFARYEASQFGSPYIETEHLLLGLVREDKSLTNRFVHKSVSVESIRKHVEANTTIREKTSTSVDLPLSNEGKRVLAYAVEEAERLGHKHIGTEHLLLGLLREEGCFATRLLKERGMKLDAVRKDLAEAPHPVPGETRAELHGGPQTTSGAASLSDFGRDLTQAAMDGLLDPLIGREQELDTAVEVLCRSHRGNPLLIGERGVGKSAIVAGLAQRIVEGTAPSALADNRVIALDAQIVAGWALHQRNAEVRINQVIRAMIEATNVILFIDDFDLIIGAGFVAGSAMVNGILKHWLLRGKMQCIGACTPAEYAQLVQAVPWVRDCFCELHVRPMNEEETLRVLESRKPHFETFHGVTYAAEALEFAAHCPASYLPERPLPGKALDLLDAAGARVKLRQAGPPAEVLEAMKKIKVMVARMDSAIANHEFEKARFYSDEEKKERDNLRTLREQHHLDDAPGAVVRQADVEEVVARAAGYPFRG